MFWEWLMWQCEICAVGNDEERYDTEIKMYLSAMDKITETQIGR